MTSNERATTEDRPPLSEIVHRNIQAELAFAGKKRIDLQNALSATPMYLQRRYTMGTHWSWDDVEKISEWLHIDLSRLTNRPA